MLRYIRYLMLTGVALVWLGCAPTIPTQPEDTQPYALLVLPESIRLLAVDTHTFDPRLRLRQVRVTPGAHSLRLAYVGTSASHVGQQADPLQLETRGGYTYVFEART